LDRYRQFDPLLWLTDVDFHQLRDVDLNQESSVDLIQELSLSLWLRAHRVPAQPDHGPGGVLLRRLCGRDAYDPINVDGHLYEVGRD
jgi:hypothetical protein